MRFLRQSTSVDVGVGPFLDETDGKTAETALTITQPDVRLKKNNGNWAQKAAAQTLTHEENGWYELTLDATDTDTVGHLLVAIHESGALPVWVEFHVLEEAIYDALFVASANAFTGAAGSTVANANVTQISGDATAADNLEAILDGTGGTGLTLSTITTSGTVTLNALTVSNATTLTGAVSLGSTLTVTGTTTLAAVACTTITASGAVAFQSTFAVTTSTSLGALSCTTLTASGAVAFQSTFAVTTSTSLAALSATTFATSGTTTFNALTVTNATTLSGAVSLGSTLGITGAITATNASNNVTLGTFTVTTNAIAWNAAWDAEVQSECADALVAYDGLVPADLPANFAALGINASGHVSRVTLVDTLTTYTSNTPQTGDSFARIGATGSGLTSLAQASVCTEARLAELDAANIPADVDQIKADLPSRPTKNTALANFEFLMIDSTDHVSGKTGLTVTATRSIDGAAFAACANSVSEVANGIYKINLAAADLNGDVITLKFTATGADARFITIVTQP